jgi:glycosyltransferase involved in cell wall biosynthesis
MNARARDLAAVRLMKFVALFGFGGTERQVMNLVRHLDRSHFALHLGCLKRWGHLLDEIDAQQVPVTEYRVNSLRHVSALRQLWRLACDLRRTRTDIVHSYNFYANVFAVPAARLARVPVVIASVRDAGVYLTPAQKRTQALIVRMADCILTNADSIRQWLMEQGVRAEQIRVIRNGIDLEKFAPPVDDRALRHELGLPADAPIVLMLARLDANKGLEDFLEAAAAVSIEHSHAHFLIVGEGYVGRHDGVERNLAYQQFLEFRVAELGLSSRVHFTGFRSDVPALLAAASISVLPSWSEGLSNTVLESMAAGVPVVATRVGGNPELIEDGVHGLLVPPRDVKNLTQAICALLREPGRARALGEAGRARVRERFSIARMVRETEALYDALLEQRRRGARAVRAAV